MDIEWTIGRLYGNLLHRDADVDGYRHYIERLLNGDKLVNLVVEILLSDEFCEKFLYNDTPNEIARKLIICLFDEEAATPEFIKFCAKIFIDDGIAQLVQSLANDDRYFSHHGEHNVPAYR